jgi:hypothetical protein
METETERFQFFERWKLMNVSGCWHAALGFSRRLGGSGQWARPDLDCARFARILRTS